MAQTFICWFAVWGMQFPPQTAPIAEPSSRPVRAGEFQPGIRLDWPEKTVRADARVVFREGPVEYLACRPGKEHESILLLEGSATHLFMAMGLIGLTPGKPPGWDDERRRPTPASGDLIDILVEWRDGETLRSAALADWIIDIEYGRVPPTRPMVFAGSVQTAGGLLASDRTGSGIALVDFGDSLISPTRNYPDRNADLWALANTPAIPPLDAQVALVIRAARPQARVMRLDFRGDFYVDDRYCTPADAADLIRIARLLDKTHVQSIQSAALLDADVNRVSMSLESRGIERGWYRLIGRGRAPDSRIK